MTLKLIYAGFNYVADIDGSYTYADSLSAMQSITASNSVALTDDYGIDAATSTVYGDYNTATTFGNTETIANLTATIQEAESDGMTVMVRPLIDFTIDASQAMLLASDGTQYENGDWRAYYNPTNVAQFFSSYDTMIVNEAKAAQAGGAQILDIGTELDQLTGPAYTSYWTKIISDVRAVYSGQLTYSAISDDDLSPWQYGGGQPAAGTGDITTQVSFWSQLDYIGIDEYAAISDAQNGGTNPDPTLAQLIAGWEDKPTDPTTLAMTGGLSLIQYYEKISTQIDKPLLFTEIGYNSAPDAASQPFYTSSSTYDPTLQANLYKAFFQAWADQGNTSLQGVYIWDWEPNPSLVGAGSSPTWTPQGNAGAITTVDLAYSAATTPTPSPGTPTPDSYVWTANAGGDWGSAANWDDVTTGANPATIAPGVNDSVTINGGANAAETITGLGNSSSLTTTNLVTLSGSFTTSGPLTVGTAATAGTLMVAGLLTSGSSATVVNGLLTAGAGGSVTIAGTLVLGGPDASYASDSQSVMATGGGRLQAGNIVLSNTVGFYTNGYLATDAASSIEIGDAGAAVAGSITIDNNAVLDGTGTVGSDVINNGSLIAESGTLFVEGSVTGGGLTEIAAGAGLDVQAIDAVTFTTQGTLTVHPSTAPGTVFPIGGVISGFVAGDKIDFAGVSVTSTSYQVTGANSGALSVFDDDQQLGVINLSGSYAAGAFMLTLDAAGTGTDLGLAPVASDFNGDGTSDLLLQGDDGTMVIETLGAGLTVTGAVNIGSPGSGWYVAGSGDFNGDGHQDILVQNLNGQLVDYLMNGTSIASGNYLANPGDGWHVRGIADFNHDGTADILLQNQADGNMVIWETNGTSITGAVDLGSPGASWTVEGVADFNGDGSPDILVQNSNGQLLDYLMDGTSISVAHYLGYPGPGWSVAGTGDYNGDGKADILLHNDNGAEVVWQTDGSTITNSVVVGNPGADFATVSAGVDLNGDGSSDMVVQAGSTGELAGYTLNNTAAITAGSVLDTPGPTWHLVTNNPTVFIDGTGSTLNLTATPGVDQFVLTSVASGLHSITGFDPAQDTIALAAGAFPSYANVQANEQPYMGGTYLNLAGDGSAGVFIKGVDPSQLNASNFVIR